MRREERLMEMRRKMGCAHYYAWRAGCRLHAWQKRFSPDTVSGRLSEYVEEAVGGLAWGMADICAYVAKNGLKTALRAIVGVYIVCSLLGACGADNGDTTVYPKMLQVVAVQEVSETGYDPLYMVAMRDCNGFTYKHYTDDLDFELDDVYACIMYDMGTRQIADDRIISMRYERVDLLGGF